MVKASNRPHKISALHTLMPSSVNNQGLSLDKKFLRVGHGSAEDIEEDMKPTGDDCYTIKEECKTFVKAYEICVTSGR